MSIITYVDFTGQEAIPGISNAGTREGLQTLIDEREPEFLAELLGQVLAVEFVTGLVLVPVEPATDPVTYVPINAKWSSLRDTTKLKKMMVKYVFYWYLRNNATLSTASGEAKPSKENAVSTSSVAKQVQAWNEMSRMAQAFELPLGFFPEYVKCKSNNIFHTINPLNF